MTETKQQTWDQSRQRLIGGTDAAKLLGVSKWGTALDVALRLRGEAPPVEETERMRWGNRMEPSLRQIWFDARPGRELVTGQELEELSHLSVTASVVHRSSGRRQMLMRDCAEPRLGGSPDLVVIDRQAGPMVVDFKLSTARDSAALWQSGEPPLDAWVQVVWYAGLLGVPTVGFVACTGFDSPPTILTFPTDLEVYQQAREAAIDLLMLVDAGGLPSAEGASVPALQAAWRKTVPAAVELSQDTTAKLYELVRLKQDIAEAEKREGELKAAIMAEMRDHEVARGGDLRVTWKWQERKAYTVEAGSSRVFRVSGGGK